MSQSKYKTVDAAVPLSFVRIRNGALVTGLAVTVIVVNQATGATLLASTALVEIAPGYYFYAWTHGLTALTHVLAIYTVGANNYPEHITLDDELDKIEGEHGNAE